MAVVRILLLHSQGMVVARLEVAEDKTLNRFGLACEQVGRHADKTQARTAVRADEGL